jgi:hypothetical protein
MAAAMISTLLANASNALAQSAPAQDAAPAGEWLAGDLHVHTTYSHDSYGGPNDDNTGPDEFYTAGNTVSSEFGIAASRGLDYLAITDHNDVRSQSDPGWDLAQQLGVIPVPGYENSLNGHAQMLGATKVYDNGDKSAGAVNTVADDLRADGGVFQINHPTDGDGRYPDNFGWKYGFDVIPDQVEVWNITRAWQKPAPSSNSADDATRYWQEWLDKGYHVAATGGSDTHWLTTTAAQGVGQPTTWVYATDHSYQGVLEGLRAGRTFISHQPPNYGGPQIFLEADSNGDGSYESMVGDTVPTAAPLRIRVDGAPGSMLRVVTDGGVEAFAPVPVTSPSFTYGFTLPAGKWARAEIFEPDAQEQRREACDQPLGDDSTYCRNQLGVLAMTSAIYRSSEIDPSPSPSPTDPGNTTTYESGDAYARVSEEKLEVGNGLVERKWDLGSFGTSAISDLRDGSKTWAGAGPDFTLDLGAAQLASTDFTVSGVEVDEISGPGLRIRVGLTTPELDATRTIEIYEGVAGFKARTTLEPKVPLSLSGYSLDSAAVGSQVVPTMHAFRAGADWRDPKEPWDGPDVAVGDAHPGTWRESHSGQEGEPIAGPGQWISAGDGNRQVFLVMERNDQPSSRVAYDGSSLSLVVDHSRDVLSLGPFEENIHVENPTPAKARQRALTPGTSLALEPSFMGFGSHDGDAEWQFHEYLVEHRLAPYAHDVTFNSNGTEGYGFSTGAKDDMVESVIAQAAPKARALGIDTFILDDGWQANSGDWYPDCKDASGEEHRDYRMLYPPRFTDCNFEKVRELIAPMKLGLWMSPMHFNPQGSETFKAHPEWACWPINGPLTAYNAGDPNGGSNEAGLGMWGPDAIPHIEARIRHAIEAWDVSYFKFDFLVWADCAGQGDLYDYRERFRAMVDRLRSDHPEVTFQTDETNDYRFFPFESVARGPSWFQNGSPEVPHLLHNLWNLSPYVPAFSIGQHFLGERNDPSSIDTRMAAALLSHPTFFSDITKLPDATIDQARPWIDFYKTNQDILSGVVYPLLGDPLSKGWTAFQSWDPNEAQGSLLAFRQESNSPTATVKLKNVPEGMTFDLFEAPSGDKVGTVTSEQLTQGFDITLNSKRSAYVVAIKPAALDPGPVTTAITFTDASARGGQYSDDVVFEASLKTASGDPLEGQEVTFTLEGEESRSYTARTDAWGIARVTRSLDMVPGTNDLVAAYAGVGPELLPTSTRREFIVEQEDTTTTIALTGKSSKRSLVARLTDRDSDAGIGAKTIEFYADGSFVCTVTTQPDGSATCPLPPRYAGGRHSYEGTFAGDRYYRSSSSTVAQ